MPFPMVYQVPQGVSEETLLTLRREIVRVTSELVDCPEDWVVGLKFVKNAIKLAEGGVNLSAWVWRE